MSMRSLTQTKTTPKPSFTPVQTGLLQRQCACGNSASLTGKCTECENKRLTLQRRSTNEREPDQVPPIVHEVLRSPSQKIQPKLKVGQTNDYFEQEADRIADEVMRMPEPSVERPVDSEEEEGKKVQRKAIANSITPLQRYSTDRTQLYEVPPSVREVLRSSGQSLDPATRALMEPRFGHEFSQVRVHSSTVAEQSARDVNAHAYTVGHNIVFGAGRFAPWTHKGRRLLAHELTHVIQQSENQNIGVIQRAEVDDRSCAGLPDIAPDIDSKVNSAISAARAAAPTPLVVADFLKDVANRVGGKFVGSIEKFIQGLSTSKRTAPAQDLSGTKFAGVEKVNQFYDLHTAGLAKVVGPAANVKSICTGADKFGHFFEEGFLYFRVAKAGGSAATLDSLGSFLEISPIQGLGVTGVFSNADKAANLAGKKFYEDLEADPNKFNFNIGNYITKDWNETANPSFYAASEGSVIWSNLLTGLWDGKFTSAGGTSSPIAAKVNLKATASGSVTGTNEWPATATKPNKEKIKNGKITQRTTSVTGTKPVIPPETLSATPVSGVTIDFDWELRSSSGKGRWESVDEQNLVGTWGIGSSRVNGGTWQLKKV